MSAAEKKYQVYTRQMMKQILEASISGIAPGNRLPYVRAELQFTEVNSAADADLNAFAAATSAAVAHALNDDRYTVEPTVLTQMGGHPGVQVSIFVYDKNGGSSDQLMANLEKNKNTIMARFNEFCPPSPGASPDM